MARRSKYQTNVLPKFADIEAWLRDGVAEKDIAKNLKISLSTLNLYKSKYSEFSELLTRTRAHVDDVVVTGAYLKRAIGYTTVEVRHEYIYQTNPLTGEVERVLSKTIEQEKHVPGDPRAMEFWLRIRKPELWNAIAPITPDEERGIILVPEIKEALEEDENDLEAST